MSIFAVNAPIINALFKAETWRTKASAGNSYLKQPDVHSSNHRGKSNKGLQVYKMTTIHRSSVESSKESVSELFSSPAVPSNWDATNSAIKKHGEE